MPFKFHGGVHPNYMKAPDVPVTVIAPPPQVVLPVMQHIGAPCKPLVEVGDYVKMGQKIADNPAPVSAPIHATVSGKVIAIEPRPHPLGDMVPAIVIENDFQDTPCTDLAPLTPEQMKDPEAILERIREAGIVGHGGAMFPTAFKIRGGLGKVDTLIINGAECEPYLTSDYRTMMERPEQIIGGLKVMLQLFDNAKGVIGIENNKPDAIAHLTKIAAGYKGIEVVPLKVMYPQGGEKQLIAAVTGRQVPPPPALPIDVGAVVCNASTTVAVYQAVLKNKPLIERVVTVTGKSVKEPKNLLTRMGTPISALIEAAGGLPGDAGKVINGGPMMGRAMVNLDSPVTKGCSGITVMSGRDAQRREATQCIKCAKCVSACPMGLEPYYLSKMTQKKGWDELEALMITSCIECGCCQSTCPAYLPLLDWVRLGKQTVMGLIRARAAAAPKK